MRVSAALFAMFLLGAALPAATAQSAGFRAEFVVNVDENTVDVSVDAALNSLVEGLVVHANAVDVVVVADGVTVALAESQFGEPDDIDRYVPFVVPVTASDLSLSYAIPSSPPRSGGYSRINPAYVSFWAFVDSAFGPGSVTVQLPPGFGGSLDRSVFELESRSQAGETWETETHAETLFSPVIGRNQDRLQQVPVSVGDHEVTVAGWEDDPEWIAFTVDTVARGVPALSEAIGQPWPEDNLVVLESTLPAEFGYGGWFSVWTSEIEVGDYLEADLLLHELAHAWFHNVTVADRWISEGWAEVFAGVALEEFGIEVAPPVPDLGEPGTSGLSAWSVDNSVDEGVFNRYDTSWYVLHTITEEVGPDATRDVLAAIFEGRRSYHASGDAAVFPKTGTTRLLDLFEEVGGSTLAEDLFRTYVLPSSADSWLEERRVAREAYTLLVETAGRPAPLTIRERMGDWKFSQAQLLIDEMMPAAERFGDLSDAADDAGTTLPESLLASYDAESVPQVMTALAEAERQLALAAAVESAEERADALADFADGRVIAETPVPVVPTSASDGQSRLLIVGVAAALLIAVGFVALTYRAATR